MSNSHEPHVMGQEARGDLLNELKLSRNLPRAAQPLELVGVDAPVHVLCDARPQPVQQLVRIIRPAADQSVPYVGDDSYE